MEGRFQRSSQPTYVASKRAMLQPPILMAIVRRYVNSVLSRNLVYHRVSSLSPLL